MKDFDYILKRIIIGVSIALLIMLIKSNFLTIVHAQSYVVGDIAIQTPSNSPVENYENIYYTNIDYDSTKDFRDYTALSYGIYSKESPSSCHRLAVSNVNESVNMYNNCSGGGSTSIYRFKIGLGGNLGFNHIELDKPYSIALQFKKDSDFSFDGFYRHATDLLHFDVYDHDNEELLEDVSFMTNVSYKLYELYNEDNPTNNAYLVINFTPSSDNFTYSTDNISLVTIEYDSSTYPVFEPYREFYPSILTNDGNKNKNFINKNLWFVQGNIDVYGAYCIQEGNSQGCGYGEGNNPFEDSDGMDVIHANDFEVFDELPTCDPLDIPCHLNRIVKSIQDLFVRFGNFFRDFINSLKEVLINLFVPSSDYLSSFFSSISNELSEQLGFLTYPFELIISFLNRFYSLQRSSIVSYNGFNFPGTNHQFIPSFTFDFDSIITGSFSTIYNYYFILINGLICLGFIHLCHKKFKSFIH